MPEGSCLAEKAQTMGAMKKILILHGWAYEAIQWEPLVKRLKESGHDAVILKIPGLTEKIDRPWNIDDYVSWLHKYVEREKNKVILLGHSNGGRISLAYAVKHPEHIDALILVDSAGIYHNEMSIRTKRAVFNALAKMGKKFTKSESLRRILYKLTHEQDYVNASVNSRETMKNVITVDLSTQMPSIKIPTLIIWGENDTTTPISDGMIMHKLIPNAKMVIIKQARHSPQFTHVAQVGDAIVTFIQS